MNTQKGKGNIMMIALLVAGVLILFNQVQIMTISSTIDSLTGVKSKGFIFFGGKKSTGVDLASVNVDEITSTKMAVASLFPELDGIQSEQDAISVMIHEGAPEYSEAIGGITFDDPVTSMEYLAKLYDTLNADVKANDPVTWERYLNLASNPRGVSCEFCCGVGPAGITADGRSRCGCKHNPAVLALTLGLLQNTEYTDAEVLREVMLWKSMFFPRNMVGIALEVAGTDPSELKELPGMVGGC